MAKNPTYEELEQKVTELEKEALEYKQVKDALQESEEKWRTFVNASRDAINIVTRDGKFIDFNQSFLDLFGYTEKEMRNMKATGLYVDPNDRVKFMHEVEEKGSVKGYEIKLQTKDRSENIRSQLCNGAEGT